MVRYCRDAPPVTKLHRPSQDFEIEKSFFGRIAVGAGTKIPDQRFLSPMGLATPAASLVVSASRVAMAGQRLIGVLQGVRKEIRMLEDKLSSGEAAGWIMAAAVDEAAPVTATRAGSLVEYVDLEVWSTVSSDQR